MARFRRMCLSIWSGNGVAAVRGQADGMDRRRSTGCDPRIGMRLVLTADVVPAPKPERFGLPYYTTRTSSPGHLVECEENRDGPLE